MLNTLFLVHLRLKGVFSSLDHRQTGRAPVASSSPPGRILGRAATKKLNVQQNSASGKVGLPKHLYIKLEVRPGWLKYPKKIAKKSFKGKSVKAPVK